MRLLILSLVAAGAAWASATVYASVTAYVCDLDRRDSSDCLCDRIPFSCLATVTVTATVMVSVTVISVMGSWPSVFRHLYSYLFLCLWIFPWSRCFCCYCCWWQHVQWGKVHVYVCPYVRMYTVSRPYNSHVFPSIDEVLGVCPWYNLVLNTFLAHN